jgi:hypothetical protein
VACDPLAPHELPITLGTLLGAGKDAGGTVYMADHVESKSLDRVFVSMGDTLWRKRVNGSGQSGGGADVDYNFSFDDGAQRTTLMIQRRGGNVTAMALGGDPKGFIGDSGAPGALTLVDAAAVAALKLRNLPGEVTIEYVADVENGNVILVTHPRDDYDYTDFRLFYGPQAALVEYPVIDVVRSRGSDTTIHFSIGATQLAAHFTFMLGEPTDGGSIAGQPGPASLDTGDGKTLAATQRTPTPAALPGSAFTCLH